MEVIVLLSSVEVVKTPAVSTAAERGTKTSSPLYRRSNVFSVSSRLPGNAVAATYDAAAAKHRSSRTTPTLLNRRPTPSRPSAEDASSSIQQRRQLSRQLGCSSSGGVQQQTTPPQLPLPQQPGKGCCSRAAHPLHAPRGELVAQCRLRACHSCRMSGQQRSCVAMAEAHGCWGQPPSRRRRRCCCYCLTGS